METALCWLLCAKVAIITPKYETIEPPKVEQQARQEDSVRSGDAKPSRVQGKRLQVWDSNEVTRTISQHFGEEADAAIELYHRESSLNPLAINKTSGACGIVQANPCSKLPCKLEDVECQVKWGKAYIQNRYKTTERALKFHDEHGWY